MKQAKSQVISEVMLFDASEAADRMATKLLDIEQQRLDLKKKYYARVKGALDAVTATRFLQMENQLEKPLDLQLAARLPAMEQGSRSIQSCTSGDYPFHSCAACAAW